MNVLRKAKVTSFAVAVFATTSATAGCGGASAPANTSTAQSLNPTSQGQGTAPQIQQPPPVLRKIGLHLRGGNYGVQKVTARSGTVVGRVRPRNASVPVNGHRVAVNAATGRFRYALHALDEGNNNFEVRARAPGYRSAVADTNISTPLSPYTPAQTQPAAPPPATQPTFSNPGEPSTPCRATYSLSGTTFEVSITTDKGGELVVEPETGPGRHHILRKDIPHVSAGSETTLRFSGVQSVDTMPVVLYTTSYTPHFCAVRHG
jgi:hypothetical protein